MSQHAASWTARPGASSVTRSRRRATSSWKATRRRPCVRSRAGLRYLSRLVRAGSRRASSTPTRSLPSSSASATKHSRWARQPGQLYQIRGDQRQIRVSYPRPARQRAYLGFGTTRAATAPPPLEPKRLPGRLEARARPDGRLDIILIAQPKQATGSACPSARGRWSSARRSSPRARTPCDGCVSSASTGDMRRARHSADGR